MTTLSLPSIDRYESWAAAWAEFGGVQIEGSGTWQLADGRNLGSSRAECEELIAKTHHMARLADGVHDGKVRCDHYWITEGAEVVGFVSLRHTLATEFLANAGGNIGYSVRPSRRREGHASRALGLTLERSRELGLERVLITCDDGNVGSARTIESHGGVLAGVVDASAYGYGQLRRYWIDLKR